MQRLFGANKMDDKSYNECMKRIKNLILFFKIHTFTNIYVYIILNIDNDSSFPPSISACSSSRVFSLGFVMGGRSFLLIGIEKGQSIFSAALLGKNFFSLILLKFLLLRKCDLRHTQFLKLRQSYQMLLVLTNPFLRLMLQ